MKSCRERDMNKGKKKERMRVNFLKNFSKSHGLMMRICFRTIRMNGRLGFEVLHPVQYPR